MPTFDLSPATYALDLAPGHLLEVSICGEARVALEALIICGSRGFIISATSPKWCQHVATLRHLSVPVATTYRLDPGRGLLACHILAVTVRRSAEASA